MSTLKRILYVEDDPDIQTIGRVALEHVGGFELCCCSSGSEALQRVDKFSPQLIVLDVMMPEMDGVETLHALRKQQPKGLAPVAFVTARIQSEEVDALKRLGAIGVISKPFDPMTLSSQLSAMWAASNTATTP